MKNWFVSFVILVVWTISIGSAHGMDAREALYRQVQVRLHFWDIEGAEKSFKDLLKLDSKSEAVQYLGGVLEFYKGNYDRAQGIFNKLGDLPEQENSPDGIVRLTHELMGQNLNFRQKENQLARVRFQNGKDEVMVPYVLEGMMQVRKALDKELKFSPPEKILVEIYPSSNSFISASPLTEADVKTSGTIALCKYGRILITTPRSLLRGYPWMNTLGHEYVHYLLTRKWGQNIPIWLHEGIAKYFESQWQENRKANVLTPSFQNLLAKAIRKNEFVTFEQMHPSFAKLPSAELAQLAYAQAATLIQYLMQERGGWENLTVVLDRLARGDPVQDAVQGAYGVSVPKLVADWKKWLETLHLKEVEGLDPETLQFVSDAETQNWEAKNKMIDQAELDQIPTASVRQHVHLGDLLRYRGFLKSAVSEYSEARTKMKGPSPIIDTKLGLSYFKLKEYNQAKAILTELLHFYPREGLAYEILGHVYREEKSYDKAEKQYLQAVYINPFNPNLHSGLAKLYEETGQGFKRKQAERAEKLLTQGRLDK